MHSKTLRGGFTLIELLTVIAIIAILAALLFPVFAGARESTRQASCMSQMHDIYIAVAQYYADNNKYPSVLLGYVENASESSTPSFYTGSGTAQSIDRLVYHPLFTSGQKYLRDKSKFACPDSSHNDPTATGAGAYVQAVYPSFPGIGSAGAQVIFTTVNEHNMGVTPGSLTQPSQTPYFYAYDSYDTGPALNPATGMSTGVTELHYSLDWTGSAPGPDDAQNQLKYPNPPPDKTVITWCTYHAATNGSNIIPVLMLSGTCKAAPVTSFLAKGPLNFSF